MTYTIYFIHTVDDLPSHYVFIPSTAANLSYHMIAKELFRTTFKILDESKLQGLFKIISDYRD